MTASDIADRLRLASAAYYNSSDAVQPPMTDPEFDALRDELAALDPNHPFLSEVGAAPVAGRRKVPHTIPMMSLHKITTEKEVGSWLAKLPVDTVIVVQPKLDGASVSLQYQDGVLKEALSRGNGTVGEDLMAAASKMPSIPKTIDLAGSVSVRGEVVLLKADWPKVSNYDPSKNPRNAGNGVMRRDDGSDAEHLTFVAFEFVSDQTAQTVQEQMGILEIAGFSHVAETHVANSHDDLQRIVSDWAQIREHLEYAIDGLVFKADDAEVRRKMGVSSGRPNGQMAWKWASDVAETEILDVVLTVGHSGLISPTAVLKPVDLMGVTVSNALLNNWDEIRRLDVAIGDRVEIFRAGEIIPKVSRKIADGPDRRPIEEPTCCPACDGAVRRAVNLSGAPGANTVCTNEFCDARKTGKIKRWLTSLEILGIGDELLGAMFKSMAACSPADLYRLKPADLADLQVGNGRLGESRAKSVVAAIQARKILTVDEFLGSLGIKFLGKRRVQIVREAAGGALDTVEAWRDGKTLLALAAQCQIGGMAETIVKELAAIGKDVDDLLSVVTVKTPEAKAAPVEGSLSFCLTGTMSRKRNEIAADLTARGHVVKDDVAKGLDILVQADPASASSKSKKAVKLGIPVISEDELVARFLS